MGSFFLPRSSMVLLVSLVVLDEGCGYREVLHASRKAVFSALLNGATVAKDRRKTEHCLCIKYTTSKKTGYGNAHKRKK